MLAWLKRPTTLWSSKILDAVVLAYAAFTICSQAVTFSGGTPRTLARLTVALAVAGVAAAVALAVRRWRRTAPPGAATPADDSPAAIDANADAGAEHEDFDRRRLLLLGFVLVLLGLWLTLKSPLVLWLGILGYLTLGYAYSLRGTPQVPPEPRAVARSSELLVFALAALCSFLALYAHRYRNDDCYYLNLAVTLVDAPDAPLLAEHSIHAPLPDKPNSNAVFVPYRVHAWESLGGTLGLLLGIEPMRVIHLGMAGLAAALIPLALARLFRLLDPRRWAFMLIAAMGLYLFEGSSGLGFASQGIVRAFTGKSVLLSVLVPLLVHHAITLSARPSRAAFVRLLGAQIAAVGLSSTALWLAPVTTMLATAVPLAPRLRSWRPLALGLASCSYVVGLALVIRAQLMGRGAAASAGAAEAAVTVKKAGDLRARWDLLQKGLEQAFEHPRVIMVFVAVLLVAVAVARTRLAQRYVALFCGALALLFMNPYFANFVRHNVTGEFTGQRAMWLAPVPTALALVFAALLPMGANRTMRYAGTAVAALALAAFLAFVPTRYLFSRGNMVRWAWPPGPKVPQPAFSVVWKLREQLHVGDVVLAPELVSWYLPTLTHHPYPLLANAKYLAAPKKEDRRRERLVDIVTKHKKKLDTKTRKSLVRAVRDDGLDAVVATSAAARTPGLAQVLAEQGFRRAKGYKGYLVWLAPPSSKRDGHEGADDGSSDH